jgi:hypothetical protein
MAKLGTYSTIDCPFVKDDEKKTDEVVESALQFLKEELKPYFHVRLHWNDHDFGPYPSFEVDWANKDYIYALDAYEEDEEEGMEAALEVDKAVEHFNAVDLLYSEKFKDYL